MSNVTCLKTSLNTEYCFNHQSIENMIASGIKHKGCDKEIKEFYNILCDCY